MRKGEISLRRVVELTDIKKSFGELRVLDKVDFYAEEGDFKVIVGENGSGKSTLLKIMIGLLLPDYGEVKVLGIDVKRHWKKLSARIGVALANERSLYWKLSAWENLDIFGGVYGVPKKVRRERMEKLLERFGLFEYKDKPVEEFSTGMRKKLMICKALIHSPEVLFIDEILNGLDPPSVREMVDYLNELSRKGLTVVMISHILHALPENASVALLKDGRIQMEVKYKDICSKESEVYEVFENLIKGRDVNEENVPSGLEGDEDKA